MSASPLSVDVLEQLLSLAQRLTSRRDLDSVLKDLMQGSLQLIPGSDFACVFLYDVEENMLVPVGGVGFEMRYMQHVRLRPGESLTGQAFTRKQPLLLPTPEDVRRAQGSLSKENDQWVRLAVGRPTNPLRSSLAMPLTVGDRTVGVLVIDNYDTDRNFTDIDLKIAAALADHAAIAVANAQDYQLAHRLSQELQQTLTVQHRLIGSLLAPASSFATILKTLAAVVHRPLAVLDPERRVVEGDRIVAGKVFQVRTGSLLLGYVQVGGRPLLRMELSAVEQAIPMVALEFMKRAAVEREQNRLRADLVYRILDNDRTAIQDVNQRFSLGKRAWRVLGVRLGSDRQSQEFDQIIDIANVFSATVDAIRLLVLTSDVEPRVEEWVAHQDEIAVIWGDASTGMGPLPVQLRGVLALWRITNRNERLVAWESHALYLRDFPELTLIQGLSGESRANLVERVLGPILDDVQSLETLTTWVFANRSYRRTADLLHTHPNTVRYRISRIGEQLGRDVEQDHVVGILWMALLWHEPDDIVGELDTKPSR